MKFSYEIGRVTSPFKKFIRITIKVKEIQKELIIQIQYSKQETTTKSALTRITEFLINTKIIQTVRW